MIREGLSKGSDIWTEFTLTKGKGNPCKHLRKEHSKQRRWEVQRPWGLNTLRVFSFLECPVCKVWLGRNEPTWEWSKWSLQGSPGPDPLETWWPRSGTLNSILIWWKALGKDWGQKVYCMHEGALSLYAFSHGLSHLWDIGMCTGASLGPISYCRPFCRTSLTAAAQLLSGTAWQPCTLASPATFHFLPRAFQVPSLAFTSVISLHPVGFPWPKCSEKRWVQASLGVALDSQFWFGFCNFLLKFQWDWAPASCTVSTSQFPLVYSTLPRSLC